MTPTKKLQNRLPKKLDDIFIKNLEKLGALQLDSTAMAAELNCSHEEFRARLMNDLDFKNAIQRGKSSQVKNAAIIVVKVINGEKMTDSKGGPVPISKEQYDAARFYLERHAPQWFHKE